MLRFYGCIRSLSCQLQHSVRGIFIITAIHPFFSSLKIIESKIKNRWGSDTHKIQHINKIMSIISASRNDFCLHRRIIVSKIEMMDENKNKEKIELEEKLEE